MQTHSSISHSSTCFGAIMTGGGRRRRLHRKQAHAHARHHRRLVLALHLPTPSFTFLHLPSPPQACTSATGFKDVKPKGPPRVRVTTISLPSHYCLITASSPPYCHLIATSLPTRRISCSIISSSSNPYTPPRSPSQSAACLLIRSLETRHYTHLW